MCPTGGRYNRCVEFKLFFSVHEDAVVRLLSRCFTMWQTAAKRKNPCTTHPY